MVLKPDVPGKWLNSLQRVDQGHEQSSKLPFVLQARGLPESNRRQAQAVQPAPSKGHCRQEPSRLPPGGDVLFVSARSPVIVVKDIQGRYAQETVSCEQQLTKNRQRKNYEGTTQRVSGQRQRLLRWRMRRIKCQSITRS